MRRLLAITMLAMICTANADDGVSESANPFGVLAGSTLTCSATSQVAGCYLERPVFTVGPVELSIGIDTQAAYAGGRTGHLAPYVGAAFYAPTWSAWLEVFMPHSGVPIVGRADWFRVGFSMRF